jgi:O-antigen/teichoic acid export membrane protein
VQFHKGSIKRLPGIGDFILYLSGSMVVALVAIFRLPVFTAYFTPAEFGFYSLVSITYTYLSIALYNWISSCLYRYYNEYRDENRSGELYAGVTVLFLLTTVILLAVTLIWSGLAGNSNIHGLILPAFGSLVSAQVLSVTLVVYKLQRRAWQYNLIQAVQALAAFLVVLRAISDAGTDIRILFIAQLLVNLVLLGILIFVHRRQFGKLPLRSVTRDLLAKLIRYGFVGFASAVGVYVLISSDRYIISMYNDISRVGIYNQVYQIGQVSVYFLVTVFFNTITPGFNRLLTGYAAEREKQLTAYVQAFLLLTLPVTFYVSLFAREVAEFLLGEAFRQGYAMIPWIVTGSFIYGLTLFNETKMKFESRFAPVLRGVVLACVVNAGLNFLLVPALGYSWAAVTTLVAYGFMFLYYYRADRFAYFRNPGLRRALSWIMLILLLQGLTDQVARRFLGFHPDKWITLAEGMIFIIIYTWAVFRLNLVVTLPVEDQTV